MRTSATQCFLVQLQEFVSPQNIFTEYAYFSSYSDSWVEHARRYAEMAIGRFGLGAGSKVMEIASNDGYLLQHFVAAGVPVLGIEPAANVARGRRSRRACRPRCASSAARRPRRDRRASTAGPTCCWATTCWPTCPTSTTSSPA